MPTGDFWTAEKLDSLKLLFEAGRSASEIADELGAHSRNAVCGKLSRLGLVRGVARRHPSAPPVSPKGPRKGTVGSFAWKVIRGVKAKQKGLGAPDAPLPAQRHADVVPLHLDIQDLTDATCRWPYGDGPFTFCGCQKISDGPYCYEHDVLSKPAPAQRKAWGRAAA